MIVCPSRVLLYQVLPCIENFCYWSRKRQSLELSYHIVSRNTETATSERTQKSYFSEEWVHGGITFLDYSKVAAGHGITHITPFRNLFPPWTSLSESQSHFRGFVLWCFFTSVTQRQLSPQSIIKKFIIHGKVAALTNLTFRASNFPLSKLASEQGLTLESFTHLLRGLNYLYPLQHNKLPSVSRGGRRSPNVSVIL